MVAMTVVASRRRQIALVDDRLPVNALLILLKLVGWNFIGRHIFRIGVTRAAGFSDPGRVDRRTRIVGRSDRVRCMAARASRHFRVFLILESLAMNRRVILGDLIDAQRRIISPHEVRIRVAFAAHFHHLNRRWLADIAFLAVHRLETHNVGVTTVTGSATKSLGGMDIGFVELSRLRQLLYAECQMAGCAAIFLRLCFRSASCQSATEHNDGR